MIRWIDTHCIYNLSSFEATYIMCKNPSTHPLTWFHTPPSNLHPNRDTKTTWPAESSVPHDWRWTTQTTRPWNQNPYAPTVATLDHLDLRKRTGETSLERNPLKLGGCMLAAGYICYRSEYFGENQKYYIRSLYLYHCFWITPSTNKHMSYKNHWK